MKTATKSERRSATWITGIGAVTPLGIGFTTNSENLLSGTSGISVVTSFDTSDHPCRIAGQVSTMPCPSCIDPVTFAHMSRFDQCALLACSQALQDAGLWDRRHELRVGLVLGLGAEWMNTWEMDAWQGGKRLSHPAQDVSTLLARIQSALGIRGLKLAISAACASGNHALEHARRWLDLGWADICLAGSCDMGVTPCSLASFGNLRALSRRNDEPTKALRPFDRDRDGMVMGEGGAVFVLERATEARRRGQRVYAELAGCGASSDAYHLVIPCPNPDQGVQAILNALADAEISADQVDYVNAHATGTPVGDICEVRMLQSTFKDRLSSIPVSSTKSMTGHLLSAAAAVEALACITAIQYAHVPPTINLDAPDPECALLHVANHSRPHRVRVAISNSFGFGGNNTCVVFRAVA